MLPILENGIGKSKINETTEAMSPSLKLSSKLLNISALLM
jgi:hypothetical protein